MLTSNDLKVLVNKGIKPDQVKQQIQNFVNGFPFAVLDRPATLGDGIRLLNDEEKGLLISEYLLNSPQKKIVKFIPASGAATRMFKDLLDYLNGIRSGSPGEPKESVKEFFDCINNFAFWENLKDEVAKKGVEISEALKSSDFRLILAVLLEENGMKYGSLPKGLLLFHRYEHHARTALEEHLIEAAHYARDSQKICRLHFTVSPEHKAAFLKKIESVKPGMEKALEVKFEVEFSIQKSSTDMIAADLENKPFRDPDGSLVFRPGGHGALLENLDSIDADIVFMKNIDNVVPDHLKSETYRYKMILGGLLIQIQEKVFRFGKLLQATETLTEDLKNEIILFLNETFGWNPATHPGLDITPREILINALKRPIRVCGMVRNQGEPGGGPFWVSSKDGNLSLQIIESSQIDFDNPSQKEIAGKATYFNPVDLVCSLRDWNGNHFHLTDFRDPETGFITLKSKDGKELKAQELPGLWNGAMAWWNTIFVEVPLETFNPVKTVNDLLRPAHQ